MITSTAVPISFDFGDSMVKERENSAVEQVLSDEHLLHHILDNLVYVPNDHQYYTNVFPFSNELQDFDPVIDNGATHVLSCGARSINLQLVCRKWRRVVLRLVRAAQATPLELLAQRIKNRLKSRYDQRDLLSESAKEILDFQLYDAVVKFRPFRQRNETWNEYCCQIDPIIHLLDRGASTDHFQSKGQHRFLEIIKNFYGKILLFNPTDGEDIEVVIMLRLLQELACAAGMSRCLTFLPFGSRLSHVSQEWMYEDLHSREEILFDFFSNFVVLGYGYFMSLSYAQDFDRKLYDLVRRLTLGLVRILMHRSALDQMEYIGKVQGLLFNPESRESFFWHRNVDYGDAYRLMIREGPCKYQATMHHYSRSLPKFADREFIADFLVCVRWNHLADVVTKGDLYVAMKQHILGVHSWVSNIKKALLYSCDSLQEMESEFRCVGGAWLNSNLFYEDYLNCNNSKGKKLIISSTSYEEK